MKQVSFMAIFKPDIYKKNIFDIDYLKLKKDGIKCLVFDLDNTCVGYKEKFPTPIYFRC